MDMTCIFGLLDTLNDIIVLDRSPIFHEVLQRKTQKTDGIYPYWATFVKSILLLQSPKHRLFAKKKGDRKDVKRTFEILKSRFSIVCGASRTWCKEII